MDNLREHYAFTLWKAEAERAAPNVAAYRTPEAFNNEVSEDERKRWLFLADAVLAELRKDADAHPQPDQGKDLAQALMASEIVTWLAENPPSAPTASEEYLNGLNDAHRLILSAMSVLASKAWEKLPADVQLAEDPVAALYASKDNRHAD